MVYKSDSYTKWLKWLPIYIKWYEKKVCTVHVFGEEKGILRYCPFIENEFGYYIRCVCRILVARVEGAKNYKNGIIMLNGINEQVQLKANCSKNSI